MMQMKRWIAVVLMAATFGAAAEDLDALKSGASADLQKAMAELSTARKEVETERLPLARKLTELEQKLTERKGELAKLQRFQENQLVELNALKAEARKRGEEVKFVESLLSEYSRAFRSRLNFIEEPHYQALFENTEKAAGNADLSSAEKFSKRSALLSSALQRDEAALGGQVFEGRALNKAGKVQAGKVAVIGPVSIFASTAGEEAGVLQQELNKSDPTIFQLDKKMDDANRALVMNGEGQMTLDPTLGNAFKLKALEEPLYERLAKGGLIMIPLLGLGLASVLVALFKWFQLVRVRVTTEADLQKVLRFLENGEQSPALAHARRIGGPAGDLLATAVENFDQKKEDIEELVYEKMLGSRARLERGIPFLALTATTGPLLGLLGTVMGMIATFKMISSFGSGDPKQLAAGISEALICTATGMAVAIPSLLFHAFLSRKAKGIVGSMEQTAVGFINGIPEPEKATFS